jgi:hypothetical protein
MSLRIDTTELYSSSLVLGNTGLGVLATAIPSSGVYNGPGFVYSNLSLPSDNTKEIYGHVTSTTLPGGDFYGNEDTSFVVSGSPAAGVYSISYDMFVDGVLRGSFTATFGYNQSTSFAVTLDDTIISGSGSSPATTTFALTLEDTQASLYGVGASHSLRIDTTEYLSSSLFLGDTGLGVFGGSLSTPDANGSPYAYINLVLPADNYNEIRGNITSNTFPAGTFIPLEDTSFTLVSPPNGNYVVGYDLYVNGVLRNSYTLNIGVGHDVSFNITLNDTTSSFTSTGVVQSLRIDTTDLISSSLVIGNTGLGVLGLNIPSTGTDGPGFLYNDLSLPADLVNEFYGHITSNTFPAGTFYSYEDSSFSVIGAPTGIYNFVYDLYQNGVLIGSTSAQIAIGGGVASFNVTLDNNVFSGNAFPLVFTIFNVTTDDTLSGFNAAVSYASFNITEDSTIFSGSASAASNFQTNFNLLLEDVTSSFSGSGPVIATSPLGGVAVHIGGGICITTNGQIFTVIL